MDIRFTNAKGKTINKDADAFLDLTVITADGDVSGKRVELATKKFAKNLRSLYTQLSRQEDLKVESESSPSRLLYEIIIKSVEETLDKEEITTLLISADRGLQAIPFAALNDSKKYFGEKYAFSMKTEQPFALFNSPTIPTVKCFFLIGLILTFLELRLLCTICFFKLFDKLFLTFLSIGIKI